MDKNNSTSIQVPIKKDNNVIWIFGDQLRAQALGYRGDPNVRTPNIDNLAREGVRFDCAVSGAPWCCPTRASLLTSLYPNQTGVIRTPSKLDSSIPTITVPFRKAGYHTAWIGKWHLGGSNSCFHYITPEQRGGFDYWLGYENNNSQNETFVYGTECEEPYRLPGYETDSLTDLLIEHLEKHTKRRNKVDDYQPFFAVLSVQPPHSPYVTPTTSNSRYYHNPAEIIFRKNVPPVKWVREKAAFDLSGYYGMIENLDMNIGKIRMALKRLGIDRETYIVFFSDHGDCVGSHGQWAKSSPWEEAIKIPFIISKIGGKQNNLITGINDVVINHIDIGPTTLGLCNIEKPGVMIGYDYSDICNTSNKSINAMQENIKDNSTEPDSAYLQQITRKIKAHTVNQTWRGVLMRDGWKYVCMPGHDWLLFNTKEDPYEMNNLCFNPMYKNQRNSCYKRLERWIFDTGDDFKLPPFEME